MNQLPHNIFEGLTLHSLDHLILPLISIDEYESKISDKRAIVVGFFVREENPAIDLSNFIDRSSYPILDTEVSPAPTTDGHFMVFVEIQRDKNFPKILVDITKEVKNLCEIKSWSFQCPDHEDPQPLSIDNISKSVILDQEEILEIPDEEIESNETAEEVEETAEFWKNASVDSIKINESKISLSKFDTVLSFCVEDSIPTKLIIDPDSGDARKLQTFLGPAYGVFAANDGFVIEQADIHKFIKISH